MYLFLISLMQCAAVITWLFVINEPPHWCCQSISFFHKPIDVIHGQCTLWINSKQILKLSLSSDGYTNKHIFCLSLNISGFSALGIIFISDPLKEDSPWNNMSVTCKILSPISSLYVVLHLPVLVLLAWSSVRPFLER